jgi:CRISPR system Cascade subunit CasD
MHTLLLRLAGPMQSWGTQSRFLERDTGFEPSKSGVIGLLCAALGISRDEPVDALAALVMGVRVDREGTLRRDYQTAEDVVRADGSRGGTVVSNRYFLADAHFLVGLTSSDLTLLQRIDEALASPHWPVFLGRKSYLPGLSVRVPEGGVREGKGLEEALRGEPWRPRLGDPRRQKPPEQLRVILETTPTESSARRIDQPEPGAAFRHRRFVPRHILIDFWRIGSGPDEVRIGEASDV